MEKKQSILSKSKNLIMILAGNAIYALAISMFVLPNGLITGGTTGLALIFQHLFGISSISMFVMCFNAIMFFLGAAILGKKFALTTLVSTFFYPFILEVQQRIPGIDSITNDKLLSTLFAGLLIGFGIGIVIRSGASTGGMDIPPLVLNKKFKIPISFSLYLFDLLILLGQMLFADKEMVLYGILLVFIYTVLLDKVLLFGNAKTQVKIISQHYDQISSRIIQELDRGVTLLNCETGFYHQETKTILTILSNRELPRLNQLVMNIDPNAFMIINQVNEVKGRGFTIEKLYPNED